MRADTLIETCFFTGMLRRDIEYHTLFSLMSSSIKFVMKFLLAVSVSSDCCAAFNARVNGECSILLLHCLFDRKADRVGCEEASKRRVLNDLIIINLEDLQQLLRIRKLKATTLFPSIEALVDPDLCGCSSVPLF